jgi:hypothetical protein
MKAVITMPHLDRLSLSGTSQGTVKGFESTKSFTLKLGGASVLHGAIIAGKMDYWVSGASRGVLEESGTDAKLECSGASKLNLAALSLENLDVHLSGASSAMVSVKKKLNYDLSGASSLTYRGKPEIGRNTKTGTASARRAKE